MMEFEFFINSKMGKQTVLLGRYQLRFKMRCAKEMELKPGDILRVGLDKEERPIKHLYVLKDKSDSTVGFKVVHQNGSYLISFKGIYDKLKLSKPCHCAYELFTDGELRGIKILLPEIT